ncbi:unnamed protein product [Parnassius mnemosyne]|uniref:Uncharacterized protein n=1 Tax=Parnassius mnemosyne TaxID=213953 RepID=A0AAV1KMM8_9NEOP
MSDTIDLERNNLCTTQDAFEHFQAVSMYEESEYIALPNTSIAQPGTAGSTNALKDLSCDTEVEISSTVDDQLQSVKSTSIPCKETKKAVRVNSEKKVICKKSSKSNARTNKRGRKKKNLNGNNGTDRPTVNISPVPLSHTSDIAEDVAMDEKDSDIRDHQVSTTQGNSGTIEEKISVKNVSKKSINKSHNKKNTAGKRGRPRLCDKPIPASQKFKSNESIDIEENQNKTKSNKGRRGRPKKLSKVMNTKLIPENIESEIQTESTLELTKHAELNSAPEDLPLVKLKNEKSLDEYNKEVSCDVGRLQKKKSIEKNMSAEKMLSNPECVPDSVLKESQGIVENTFSNNDVNNLNEQTEQTENKCNLNNSKEACDDSLSKNNFPDDDEADDICLSKLKKTLETSKTEDLPVRTEEQPINSSDINVKENDVVVNGNAINSKMPNITGYDIYNDNNSIVANEQIMSDVDNAKNDDHNLSCVAESSRGRPLRRKGKKTLHYDEGSDEDPFANVELSDDDGEPRRSKKGRCYSDDEYIPGRKRGRISSSDTTDSDIDKNEEELKKTKKKRVNSKNTKQKGKKHNIDSLRGETSQSMDMALTADENSQREDGVDVGLESKVIRIDDDYSSTSSNVWGTTHEFENFLAKKIQGTNLKIQKVSNIQPRAITPLEIPVIDPNMAKKTVEMSAQTNAIQTKTASAQTSTPYDIPMKNNVPLSAEQAEKACEFLKDIVKTTSELGELMTQKSEDFIQKKINTKHVTDTFKMDYCVRKSFLLFKLAKHNLMQMEEDLSKQYEEFLKKNDLLQYREVPKSITPQIRLIDSDSDCEIIEDTQPKKNSKSKEQPKFNLKTVFLNKELSIKIAKKPNEEPKGKDKINIKGKRTVWLNDSVMVKKVQPKQSFLAQDSRNKKPPDTYVTYKMVRDFFKDYYRQTAISICAPFITTEWFCKKKSYVHCNYFCVRPLEFNTRPSYFQNGESTNSLDASGSDINTNEQSSGNVNDRTYPKALLSLCVQVLQNNLIHTINKQRYQEVCDNTNNAHYTRVNPETLFRLCVNNIRCILSENNSKKIESKLPNSKGGIVEEKINSLKTLCYKIIVKQIFTSYSIRNNCNILLTHKLPDNHKSNTVNSLFSLCVNIVQKSQKTDNNYKHKCNKVYLYSPSSLKYITFSYILSLMRNSENDNHKSNYTVICNLNIEETNGLLNNNNEKFAIDMHFIKCNEKKELLQKNYKLENIQNCNSVKNKIKKLSKICFEKISLIFGENYQNKTLEFNSIQINSVNTVPEELFSSLQNISPIYEEDAECCDVEDTNSNDEDIYDDYSEEINQSEKCKWELKQQLTLPTCPLTKACENTSLIQIQKSNTEIIRPEISQVKSEPFEEDILENEEIPFIKIEQDEHDEESSFSPLLNNVVAAKQENVFQPSNVLTNERVNNDYNESFLNEEEEGMFDYDNRESFNHEEKVFSQSSLRVRRQFEPDSDTEADNTMSLLVPHTFESLNIDKVRSSLMENNTSDEETVTQKRTPNKKKIEKRKTKPKPLLTKRNKDVSKELPVTNEVDLLAEKMQNKIRQTEKNTHSSDSETENIALSLRSDRKTKKDSIKDSDLINKIILPDEIQCTNVDSTQKIVDHVENISKNDDKNSDCCNLNKNVLLEYNKYVNDLYTRMKLSSDSSELKNDSKVVSNSQFNEENEESDRSYSPAINPDEPIELLQCEPNLSFLSNDVDEVTLTKNDNQDERGHDTNKTFKNDPSSKDVKTKNLLPINLNEWECYPVNINDTKLYQQAVVVLEKLPEAFVETYFKYQDILCRDKDDMEVERLTNLQSLHRTKYQKVPSKATDKPNGNTLRKSLNSRSNSPSLDIHQDSDSKELTASEDELDNADELIPPVQQQISENCLAKNTLMEEDNDNDLLPDKPIKEEPEDIEENLDLVTKNKQIQPKKIKHNQEIKGIKTKLATEAKIKLEDEKPQEPLMLTADKVMNKELTLLNTPVVMRDDISDSLSRKSSLRNSSKRVSKNSVNKDRVEEQDHSSSEEEKQWVNTKEKLLKRMEKKQEDSSIDDAKRAKLVSEFIEKCEAPESRKRHVRGRGTRSRKKFWERQKQLSVLSKELFGESSDGSPLPGKKFSHAFGKGRRNIRKVIDKKSLARSTVIANMEEFERKRRLIIRQTRLRKLLDCEEGQNILVINQEVCLEYDFEKHSPVVTIHPFFTKVMKAHQCHGVKFMWDACFESLAMIEAGHPGGGCILAHCMGLGKTLQVLALLHTVLTHPRVGIQRVLVCCPLSTVLNWVDEIHKWIGPVTNKLKVFELSKLKKTYERAYQLEDWYNGGGIFIIGYELFRNLSTLDPVLDGIRPTIVNKIRMALLDPGPDIIVCDEGHLLKNDSSVLAVAMSRVATKRRIVLTGTPMQNNLREYYCMVNFVKPNLLGSYSEYSNRFENPIMNGQHRDSREEDIKLMKARTHILHKVLEGCLQRQEASVLYPYLPKKHEYTVFIPLTKCQSDLYKHYLTHYTKVAKQSTLRDFHILQKIWTHPQVLHNFQMKSREDNNSKIKVEKIEDDLANEDLTATEDIKPAQTEVWWLQYLEGGNMLDSLESSNKLLAVFHILAECLALGDKVLLFSTSLFTMDTLEYFLKRINNWSLGREYYRLDGSVPAEVRQKWCREFNADSNQITKLFLISTRAGSLGLNMTAANRVIILDTSWNPAHDIQSIFRVYRFGQKKDCYIYRLVALGTMEQKIYERAVTKQAVACRVVDEQQIDRHYNMDELTELYKLDESGSGVASGVAVGVTDVALLRVARDVSLHAVHEHDSLLRGSAEQQLPEHERAAAWLQFEQEQAHTQMQNLGQSAFKTPTKRLHGHDYAKSPVHSPVEIKNENDEKVPKEKIKLRSRKTRKNSFKDRILLEQEPSTSKKVVTDDTTNKESVMVQQIKNILVQNDFLNHYHASDIENFVTKVRQVVDDGLKAGHANVSDIVTESISKVLLNSDITAVVQSSAIIPQCFEESKMEHMQTTSNNEISIKKSIKKEDSDETKESTTKNKNKCSNKKENGRKRTSEKEEQLTSGQIKDISTNNMHKRRRKAALKAREHLDSLDLTFNQDDDDEWNNSSISSLKKHKARQIKSETVTCNKDKEDLMQYENSSLKKHKAGQSKSETVTCNKEKEVLTQNENSSLKKHKAGQSKSETVTCNKEKEVLTQYDNSSLKKHKAGQSKSKTVTCNKEKEVLTQKENSSLKKHKAGQSKNETVTCNKDKEVLTENDKILNREKDNSDEETLSSSSKPEDINKNGIEMNSILLSDDDDDLIIEPKQPETSKKVKNTVERQNEDNDNENEQIPLHPSLLTNNNFIKIVAHTYLTGNPMLDEDAAVLAAQYSTHKALKEIEMTGKDLCSGPIYDIAVNVVGKDTLKKLYTSNINQPKVDKSKTNQANEDDREQEQTTNDEPQVNQSKVDLKSKKLKDKKHSKDMQSSKYQNKSKSIKKRVSAKQIEERKKSSDSDDLLMISEDSISLKTDASIKKENSKKSKPLSSKLEKKKVLKMGTYPLEKVKKNSSTSTSPPKLQTSIPEAVPVELIRSSTNSPSQQSTMASAECILPDDDDNFLDSDDDAVYLINEPSPPVSKKSPTQQGISKSFIFDNMWDSKTSSQKNEIASDTPSISTPPTPSLARISLENKANTPNNESSIIIPDVYLDNDPMDNVKEQVPAKDTAVTNTTVGSPTICLDSDEEEDTPVMHEVAKGTISNPDTNVQITQPPLSVTTMASNVVPLQSLSTLNTPVSSTPETPSVAPDNRIMIPLDQLQHRLQILNHPKVGESAASEVDSIKDINLTHKIPVQNNKVTNTPTSLPVKRICKPGDVIRINSSRDIVILNKNSHTLTKSNSNTIVKEKVAAAPKVTSTSNAEKFLYTNKTNIDNLSKKIEDPKVQQEADAQFSSSNNPLSILKNVVHIEADEYDKTESSKAISNQTSKDKELIKQSNTEVKSNTHDLTEYVPIQKVSNINKPVILNNILRGPTMKIKKLSFTPFKQNLGTGLLKKKFLVTNSVTNLSTSSKTNSAIINSVDLTDTVSDNNRNLMDKVITIGNKSKNTSKGYVATITGSAKDLKIVRTGEKSSPFSVDLTDDSSSRSNDFIATVDAKTSDTKKIQKTLVTSEIAKKKSFEKLTLKDFDIEDIDDIIELD